MSDENTTSITTGARGVWAEDEHERFLEALHYYPSGPWKAIAEYVGTRTIRQVQTHAQKYHEKAARRLRNLSQSRGRSTKPSPSIDSEMHQICEALHRRRVPLSPRSAEQQQRSVGLIAEASWLLFGEDEGGDITANEMEALLPMEDLCFDECLDFLIKTLCTNDDSAV
jgi:SHAQKYF class myb-like DNA-binding protein